MNTLFIRGIDLSERSKISTHVLLAEDNELAHGMMETFLLKAGLSVDICTNGLEVLSKLEKNAYDLILMDIHMPIMDGYEVTRAIRKSDRFHAIPVIALSGVDSVSKELFDDYLAKPVDREMLLKKIQNFLPGLKYENDLISTKIKRDNSREFDAFRHLNINEVLARYDDNHSLLRKILVLFYETYQDVMEEFLELWAGNDRYKKGLFFHKMKGAASNVGAMTLFHLAGEIESALQNNTTDVLEDKVAQFKSEFNLVMDEISGFVSRQETTTNPQDTV